jgi:hypothetical protein
MLLQHTTDDNEPCTTRLPTARGPQHLRKDIWPNCVKLQKQLYGDRVDMQRTSGNDCLENSERKEEEEEEESHATCLIWLLSRS